MRTFAAVAAISCLVAPSRVARAEDPGHADTLAFTLPPDDTAPGVRAREVMVDAVAFTGTTDVERVIYDLDAVLRPLSVRRLGELPDWAVAVRLVLSEVGADRVLQSRYGLLEAMGVIETVRNRLDPAVWNPNGIRGLRPWPGCGEDASFADCANPQQYYGMSRDRALNPASAYGDREMLLAAIDRAVAAWWLLDTHVVADVTQGATSFHHACGGSSYGADPQWCSSTATGPIVFKGPVRWMAGEGRYDIREVARVDYRRGGTVHPGSFARYLWGELPGGVEEFVTPEEELDRVLRDGSVDAPSDTGLMVGPDVSRGP